nr:major capsid protein [Ectropis obliqua nucleopolyhedrovirus]
MEKMVLPIPDADNNIYYRIIGKSLVSHTAVDDERILIPTKANYIRVLNVNSLPYVEQIIWHMIYQNKAELDRVCKLAEANERYQTETYALLENIYARTAAILAIVNPENYCAGVDNNAARIWSNDNANDTVNVNVFNEMPPFMQNLITRLVAPCKMTMDTTTLLLREMPTCMLQPEGLVAHTPYYNPVEPKYSRANENMLQIENVLKFKGNANALQKNLNRYEPYPIIVPLFLGFQVVMTVNSRIPRKTFVLTEVPTEQPILR